jgi:hypothetical protein
MNWQEIAVLDRFVERLVAPGSRPPARVTSVTGEGN